MLAGVRHVALAATLHRLECLKRLYDSKDGKKAYESFSMHEPLVQDFG